MVLYIKNIASKVSAKANTNPTSLVPLSNLTKSSTVAPPKSTESIPSTVLICLDTSAKEYPLAILTINTLDKGLSSR